jgi:hypothetical protein
MLIHRSMESMATKPRPRALLADPALQVGLDVGQEEHVAVLGGLGELGLERLEDVELRHERLARVEVAGVDARPEEGLAPLDVLDVVRVRPARAQVAHDASSKSSPTGPDDADLVENDAARAKWVAAPPSMRSRSPAGVRTAS